MTIHLYSFDKMLKYSQGVQQKTDIATIRALFPSCRNVVKTDLLADKTGVDYIVTLRKGARVLIDAKTRQPGVSRVWKDGKPEIALEVWSVLPQNDMPGKVGWTLSEASQVDYILYIFDPTDCNRVFLYPFQLLRLTFRNNFTDWCKRYKPRIQSSGSWQSQCLFIPEHIVWEAMRGVAVINVAK